MHFVLSFIFLFFSSYVGAQQLPEIPEIITQSCQLTPDKLIDHCPQYWQDIKTYHTKVIPIRQSLYASGGLDQLKTYSFTQTNNIFLDSYGPYIYNRLTNYLYHTSISRSDPIDAFFTTTYRNQEHSGLGLHATLYKMTSVSQLTQTIPINFAVRNFRTTSISAVEDIYCFTTIGTKDYIIPARLPIQSYTSNSITNIVLSLDIQNTPLTDTVGVKNLFCTLVYADSPANIGIKPIYTDWTTISFDVV